MAVLGPGAVLRPFAPGREIASVVRGALGEGFDAIIAAGGDGTIVSVAHAMTGQDVPMGVLPLGTFNYFSRGLGLPEDPAEAAKAIVAGTPQAISVGTVNGQVFLNNASLGLYPYILQRREDTYRRFGRSRAIAYWTVARTFLNLRRPRPRTISANGVTRTLRTPLIFAARSAYQLREFGLSGAQAVDRDHIALFVLHETTRLGMFRMAWRLLRRKIRDGEDVDIIVTDRVDIRAAHSMELVAYDGEKRRTEVPVTIAVRRNALNVIMPGPAVGADGENAP